MVRPGRYAACDLDVKRRITVQEIRVREQPASDLMQPLRRRYVGARDSQLVQPAMKARHMALALEQRTADGAPYFVDGVAEHEAAVVDRNGGGGAR
jgi:hypothetical protein